MKRNLRKVLAVITAALTVIGLMTMGSLAAPAEDYTPHRSITLTNNGDSQAILQMEMLPFMLGENGGPYHVVAKLKIEGFEAIDAAQPAAFVATAFYGNYDGATMKPADETVEVSRWTADTDGWVELSTPGGRQITLKDFEEDVILRFQAVNANGRLTLADLIIADSKDEIVYSLANDLKLWALDGYWKTYVTNGKSSVDTESNMYEYTPNAVLKMSLPQENPVPITYISTKGFQASWESVAPLTLHGMIKVENYVSGTFCFGNVITTPVRTFRSNTGGWLPILNADGSAVTIDANNPRLDFYNTISASLGVGDMYLADFYVTDKDGNVIYRMEDDALLQEGDYGVQREVEHLYLWGEPSETGKNVTYTYSKAATETPHSDADYALKTVEETYTPYVKPSVDTVLSVKSDASGMMLDGQKELLTVPEGTKSGDLLTALQYDATVTVELYDGDDEITEADTVITDAMLLRVYIRGENMYDVRLATQKPTVDAGEGSAVPMLIVSAALAVLAASVAASKRRRA